jgi:hypothetical protein
MPSPRITEAAYSLPEGEGRHGMHALVRHAGEKYRYNVRDDIENSNSSLMARLVVVLVIAFLVIGAITSASQRKFASPSNMICWNVRTS